MKRNHGVALGFGLLLAGLGVVTACGTGADDAGRGASNGSSADSTFPTATYAGCTLFATGGGVIGSLDSSVLTLATSGTSVTAGFGAEGDAGPVGTVDLVATSITSATLDAPGQSFAGEWGSCGAGAVRLDSGSYVVSSPLPAAADIELTAANAVITNGVAFLALNGPVDDVDGGPGCAADEPPAGQLTAFVMCEQQTGGASAPSTVPATSAAGAKLNAGSYACYGSVERVAGSSGFGSSSAGTLVVAGSGSSITASYRDDDSFASGALTFAATSDTTAVAAAGQAWTVDSILTTTTAAALTANGTTLFLGIAADVRDPSAPQTTTTLLVCTPS
jgi:hypothetical protein